MSPGHCRSHTLTHTHTHTRSHTLSQTHVHAHSKTCTRSHTDSHARTCPHMHVHGSTCTCMHTLRILLQDALCQQIIRIFSLCGHRPKGNCGLLKSVRHLKGLTVGARRGLGLLAFWFLIFGKIRHRETERRFFLTFRMQDHQGSIGSER